MAGKWVAGDTATVGNSRLSTAPRELPARANTPYVSTCTYPKHWQPVREPVIRSNSKSEILAVFHEALKQYEIERTSNRTLCGLLRRPQPPNLFSLYKLLIMETVF